MYLSLCCVDMQTRPQHNSDLSSRDDLSSRETVPSLQMATQAVERSRVSGNKSGHPDATAATACFTRFSFMESSGLGKGWLNLSQNVCRTATISAFAYPNGTAD